MDLLIKVVISAKFRLKPFFLSFFFFCEHLQIFLRFSSSFQKQLRQINVYPALQVWNNSSPLSTSENCFLSEIHFFNGIPQQIMLDWAVYKMYTAIQLMWVSLLNLNDWARKLLEKVHLFLAPLPASQR